MKAEYLEEQDVAAAGLEACNLEAFLTLLSLMALRTFDLAGRSADSVKNPNDMVVLRCCPAPGTCVCRVCFGMAIESRARGTPTPKHTQKLCTYMRHPAGFLLDPSGSVAFLRGASVRQKEERDPRGKERR